MLVFFLLASGIYSRDISDFSDIVIYVVSDRLVLLTIFELIQ